MVHIPSGNRTVTPLPVLRCVAKAGPAGARRPRCRAPLVACAHAGCCAGVSLTGRGAKGGQRASAAVIAPQAQRRLRASGALHLNHGHSPPRPGGCRPLSLREWAWPFQKWACFFYILAPSKLSIFLTLFPFGFQGSPGSLCSISEK